MDGGPPGFRQDFTCPALLGNPIREDDSFSPTGRSPSMVGLSRTIRLKNRFLTSRNLRTGSRLNPTTPNLQRVQALTQTRFRLFPFRSPLLGESQLLSVPGGTEMVHFSPLALPCLFNSAGSLRPLRRRGCPIRKSPGIRLFAPTRGLSQLTTSFIAFSCQGIHRMPLVTYQKPLMDSRWLLAHK